MGRHKVVILGPEDASIEAERAELADLDVEFVQANPQSEGEAMEVVKDADAIMTRAGWGTAPVMNAAERCQVLATYSHGFDNIDVEACTDNGIILTNSAGMCAEEVSDQAVAFILALNRHVVQANGTCPVRQVGPSRIQYRSARQPGARSGRIRKHRPPRCSQDDRMGHGNSRVRPVRVAVGDQGVSGRAGFRPERTVLGGRLSHRHRAAQRRNASHDRRRAVQGDEEIGVFRERVPGPGGRREGP